MIQIIKINITYHFVPLKCAPIEKNIFVSVEFFNKE
jgi:hypothetical protein